MQFDDSQPLEVLQGCGEVKYGRICSPRLNPPPSGTHPIAFQNTREPTFNIAYYVCPNGRIFVPRQFPDTIPPPTDDPGTAQNPPPPGPPKPEPMSRAGENTWNQQ